MTAGRAAPVKAGAVVLCMAAARARLKVLVFAAALGAALLLFFGGGRAFFACCAYHPVSAFCDDHTLPRRLFYTGWRIDGLCQAPDRRSGESGAR